MLSKREFAQIVDIVELAPATSLSMVDQLISDACENGFHSLACPYCYHPYVMEQLKKRNLQNQIVLIGGAGFPDGNWPTEVKLACVKHCLKNGCSEIDLTTNLGWIKSRMFDSYQNEIKAVKEIIGDRKLKIIIHAPLLTEEEIKIVCDIALRSGVDFIKTDTGRSPTPTTIEHIKIIKSFVGSNVEIKASGGIRNLETVETMISLGVSRFGMSRSSAMRILATLSE